MLECVWDPSSHYVTTRTKPKRCSSTQIHKETTNTRTPGVRCVNKASTLSASLASRFATQMQITPLSYSLLQLMTRPCFLKMLLFLPGVQ